MASCIRCHENGETCARCRREARIVTPRPPAKRTPWDDVIDQLPAGPTWPEPF